MPAGSKPGLSLPIREQTKGRNVDTGAHPTTLEHKQRHALPAVAQDGGTMATCLILSCPLHQTSQRLTALITLLPTLTGNWLFSETHQENPLNSTPINKDLGQGGVEVARGNSCSPEARDPAGETNTGNLSRSAWTQFSCTMVTPLCRRQRR